MNRKERMDMTIKTLGRHLREGVKSILRNGWMTFASVSSVMITLIIIGLSLVIAMNAEQMTHYVTGQLEINVYLSNSINTTQGQQVADEVKQLAGVQSVKLLTKAQGLQQLQQELGGQYKDLFTGINDNPLPVQLIVKASNPKQILQVASEVGHVQGVAKVTDGAQYVQTLFHVLDMIRNVGLVFVIALLLTAMFLISNTIKITIFSRSREIEIMKLVGATNWFIRMPFVIEAVLIGMIGALIPFLAVTFVYHLAYVASGGIFYGLSFPLVTVAAVTGKIAVVLFGIGILIGAWGGIMSVRKFLKI